MDESNINSIAIIGMDGRFPGADSVHKLWENVINKRDCITHFSKSELIQMGMSEDMVSDSNYVGAKGILDNAESFDADFFHYTPREAALLDPQCRVFLESAWKALEDAGYASMENDNNIGVFAGCALNTYLLQLASRGILQSYDDFDIMLNNDKDLLSTRVSYKLNLKGPSITVQTACSTSLVALHMACQSLLSGECDMALAGGVSIQFPLRQGYKYREGMIYSKSGYCKPFDENADGTLFSDGVGVVVLKRLEDAQRDNDSIYAIVKGSAINNDGADKVGFTAPSVSGQARVIADALLVSDVTADTIGYVETHGTGTKLGDSIELKALIDTFSKESDIKQYCAIGSVKANIGHLNTAAGIAGLIKTVLAVQKGIIPPACNFDSVNPAFNLDKSPFFVPTEKKDWQLIGKVRRAGISSFGIGGTNAHVILEEAPQGKAVKSSNYCIVPISAQSQQALSNNLKAMSDYLDYNSNECLDDISYTLCQGRNHFTYREFFVSNKIEDIKQKIKDTNLIKEELQKPVYFLFTGQGSQYVNMAKDLYGIDGQFRSTVQECCEILESKMNYKLLDIIYPQSGKEEEAERQLKETRNTQPALFVIEYALAKYLLDLGIMPSAMIGHSLGEYVAACISGVISLEDALEIIAERGRLMQGLPSGQMMAVALSEAEIQPYLSKSISLAAVNAPKLSVLSGDEESIQAVSGMLKQQGIFSQVLKTSHAFHSHMMDGILNDFIQVLKKTKFEEPKIPIVSNLTGDFLKPEDVNFEYWTKHLRHTVRYTDGISKLLDDREAIFIELGAGKTLSSLAKQNPNQQKHKFYNVIPTVHEKLNTYEQLLNVIGYTWKNGSDIDFEKLQLFEGKRIHLPTYQFDRTEYSLLQSCDNFRTAADDMNFIAPLKEVNRQNIKSEYVEPRNEVEQILTEQLSAILGLEKIGMYDSFYEIGGNSLLASQYAAQLSDVLDLDVSITEILENTNVAELAEHLTARLLEDL